VGRTSRSAAGLLAGLWMLLPYGQGQETGQETRSGDPPHNFVADLGTRCGIAL